MVKGSVRYLRLSIRKNNRIVATERKRDSFKRFLISRSAFKKIIKKAKNKIRNINYIGVYGFDVGFCCPPDLSKKEFETYIRRSCGPPLGEVCGHEIYLRESSSYPKDWPCSHSRKCIVVTTTRNTKSNTKPKPKRKI